MECFPPVCGDKKASVERGIGLSRVHIPLVTFVTRDGVWGLQTWPPEPFSLTLFSWAPHSFTCMCVCVCVWKRERERLRVCADTLLFSSAPVWYCAGMRVCERDQTLVVASGAWPVFSGKHIQSHALQSSAQGCWAFSPRLYKKKLELRLSSKLPGRCINSSFRNIESFRISPRFCLATPEILFFVTFSLSFFPPLFLLVDTESHLSVVQSLV